MKRLICAKDIEIANEQGQKTFYIDLNTIVTPLAKDTAKIYGIEISTKEKISKTNNPCNDDMDIEKIYKVFKTMMDKGLLSDILNLFSNKPYTAETDCCGLKLIRGNTIQFKDLETKNLNSNVTYQQLISGSHSSVKTGLLNIDNSSFQWELTYEQVYYIIEGNLTITVNGKDFVAYPGDVLYIPAESEITLASLSKAKLFYTTYLDK